MQRLSCDGIDFDKDIAQGCAHQMFGYSFCGNLANDLIFFNANVVSKMSIPKRKPSGTTAMEIVTGVGEITSALE